MHTVPLINIAIPLVVHIAEAMFLFPTVAKALINFSYVALLSSLSQAPNIFILHILLSRG